MAQFINSTDNTLISEFDTAIFALTVIPILGWFKLLPTFGGCVITVSKITQYCPQEGVMDLEVDFTTSKPVVGLQGLGSFIWGRRVAVGAIWRLLPWNKGRPPICRVVTRYIDRNIRIVEDSAGEYFVYSRPVCPRP